MQHTPQKLRPGAGHDHLKRKFCSIRGRYAEELICRGLVRKNWNILSQNFRGHGFELDIVAEKSRNLKIVEVKYRKLNSLALDLSTVESLISQQKIASLQRGAQAFVSLKEEQPESIHFDLAVVFHFNGKESIRYFENFLGH